MSIDFKMKMTPGWIAAVISVAVLAVSAWLAARDHVERREAVAAVPVPDVPVVLSWTQALSGGDPRTQALSLLCGQRQPHHRNGREAAILADLEPLCHSHWQQGVGGGLHLPPLISLLRAGDVEWLPPSQNHGLDQAISIAARAAQAAGNVEAQRGLSLILTGVYK